MSLKQQITEDMKAAMRAGDARRRDAIRLLQAAIKQREVDERKELDDAAVVAVIEKMLKQRRDSIVQYEAAHRQDLANAEKYEMEVLQSYMPQALSDTEVECAVAEAISNAGARGQQDMGRVMALLKPRLSGRADMSKVSALVKTRLAV
ncbi:hypothetical protein C8R21_102186 [Nitrosospira multiformis]|uniref:GatB/Yqey n=1 Tax=Nitrosospira multiformis TaxID=1231 RepID=A0A2T5IH65_9PROT|nr:GatB/YqeY domain-containing protein [Nitrosospira multiformis]PTQ83183.1 hypothetical protein C8R21_102186 [Nitrosospira multiformis]